MGTASGKPIAVTSSAVPQPWNSEASEVTMYWGRRNIPRKGLAFQASTHGCPSSHWTAACTKVLSETAMVGLSGRSSSAPSDVV